MKLARFSLSITSLAFLGIGLFCLFAPLQASALAEIQLPTPTAITDFRANYGGCIVGIGVFFVICLLNPNLFRLGLILQALSFGGFVFGRLVGLALDGAPKPLIVYFLLAEIGAVILAIAAIWRLKKSAAADHAF